MLTPFLEAHAAHGAYTAAVEATHEIHLMSDTDAERIIRFSETLLRFMYEMPNVYEKKERSSKQTEKSFFQIKVEHRWEVEIA